MSLRVSVEEFDRAYAEGKIELTRRNVRAIRCNVEGCGQMCLPGTAVRLFVDGHPRGFICRRCRGGT